jgi:hypothetical protein
VDGWSGGATLTAWIAADASLTWRPLQLVEANAGLGGEIAVKVGPLSMGIAVEALVTSRAPKPHFVAGDLSVEVDLPAPLKDAEIDIHLEWSSPLPPDLVDPVLQQVAIDSPIETAAWQAPVRDSATGIDPITDEDLLPIVPLDGKVTFVFDRPMNDTAAIAASGDVVHDEQGEYTLRYELAGVTV